MSISALGSFRNCRQRQKRQPALPTAERQLNCTAAANDDGSKITYPVPPPVNTNDVRAIHPYRVTSQACNWNYYLLLTSGGSRIFLHFLLFVLPIQSPIFAEPVSADRSGCNFAFPGRHEYAPLAKFVARVIAPLVGPSQRN